MKQDKIERNLGAEHASAGLLIYKKPCGAKTRQI